MQFIRIYISAGLLLIGFSLVGWRSYMLASEKVANKKVVQPVEKTQTLPRKPSPNTSNQNVFLAEQPNTKKSSKYLRANIEDRNGILLAESQVAYNIYIDGRKNVVMNNTSIKRISQLLQISTKRITIAMNSGKVTLAMRHAPRHIAKEVYQLRTPMLLIDKVVKRNYPQKDLLSRTLGFVGADGVGLTGIERYYNNLLQLPENEQDGSTNRVLRLTIDKRIQFLVEQQLKKAIKRHDADSATVIVQNTRSGAILAMATVPTFNLNNFQNSNPKFFLNEAVSRVIEPGSVFKSLFVAKILSTYPQEEHDHVLSEKKYFCNGYSVLDNGEVVQCSGVHGSVSLEDILKYSCNAGMIEATQNFTSLDLYNYLQGLKTDKRIGIDLPSESSGILPPLNQWGVRNKATITIGQGIALTPLQIITAFSSLINGGRRISSKLAMEAKIYENGILKRIDLPPIERPQRVISAAVSKSITYALTNGTIEGSTGFSSRNTGLSEVLGKTGTSQQVNLANGGYFTDRYNSMFVGAYPVSNPQFATLVLLSNPKKEYQGGKSATPIFAEIIDDLARDFSIDEERQLEKIINGKYITRRNNSDIADIEEMLEKTNYRTMPNLQGMSSRQVQYVLQLLENGAKNNNITYTSLGKGYVKNQTPPAGSAITQGQHIIVYLQ